MKEGKINMAIKDSGNRTEFETGAVRDMSSGKGRFDLMPIESLCKLLNDKVLNCLKEYNQTKDPCWFVNAIEAFIPLYWDNYDIPDYLHEENCCVNADKCEYASVLLDVSVHFEEGALKYGENNWQKGIPISSYIDSGLRHYFKHKYGLVDEHHNRAFVWNMMCAYWTVINDK